MFVRAHVNVVSAHVPVGRIQPLAVGRHGHREFRLDLGAARAPLWIKVHNALHRDLAAGLALNAGDCRKRIVRHGVEPLPVRRGEMYSPMPFSASWPAGTGVPSAAILKQRIARSVVA